MGRQTVRQREEPSRWSVCRLLPPHRLARGLARGELGAVTAELAAALPAAVLAMGIAVAAVAAAATQVGLEQAAGSAARAAGRGEDPVAYAGGAGLRVEQQGDLVCAVLTRDALGGTLTLTARSCAHGGGR